MESDVTSHLQKLLSIRGFSIRKLKNDDILATKELKRIGLKKRLIFFYVTTTDYLTLENAKRINKLFNKHKPGGTRTFFYYNIVIVTNGFDKEALWYIKNKMTEAWNVGAAFTWNVLASSYTKVTHVFDLKSRTLYYPYDYEVIKKFLHPEVMLIIESVTRKAL